MTVLDTVALMKKKNIQYATEWSISLRGDSNISDNPRRQHQLS